MSYLNIPDPDQRLFFVSVDGNTSNTDYKFYSSIIAIVAVAL